MATSRSSPQPITLNFQNRVHVAGEKIAGHVDLNVALAQEDHIEHLRIKFRGAITTKITTSTGTTRVTHTETVPYANQSLWKQGITFPEPGSHVISCPFQFQLPENLPPSFHCSSNSHTGAISYSLEVVGDRLGLLRSNRRIRRRISVVPSASENQLLVKESLQQGWSGKWRDITQEEKLRQGIWGDYSHARTTLSIPDLPSYPIATPIPIRIQVSTETKLVNASDRPEDKHGEPLFPAPPTQSSQVTQVLRRVAEVIVRDRTRHVKETFDLQGIRSLDDLERVAHDVQAIVDEPEWISKDEHKGIWRRRIHFNLTLAFPFAPSFSTETLDWLYELHFVVPFPGIGNDLKISLPIHLSASSACPPPPGATGSDSTYADVPPAGPPPMLDLPPSYWSGEDHDWDDEKN
ncbi:hypothetical protein B0H11DRAFT_2361119 [Mycena galericulata]|nr:hypothetical protein B0H11DRAFT_2361119 [Mycena galericulata]